MEIIGAGKMEIDPMDFIIILSNDESHFKFFRKKLYYTAKKQYKWIKRIFYRWNITPIHENNKLEGNIEKIKEKNYLLALKIFSINIAIYETDNNNSEYKAYAVFTPEPITNDYILINF